MTCTETIVSALNGFTDRTAEWVDDYLAGKKLKGSAVDPAKNSSAAHLRQPEREA